MFRGIVLALVLLTMVDVCFNDSALTAATVHKVHSFLTSARDAFEHSPRS